MSAYYYVVNGHPIFLTFNNYGKAISACESSGVITEHDSMANEFVGHKKEHKKVYKAICNYLKEYQETDPESFNCEILHYTCYDDEGKENLYGFLSSVGDYYGNWYFDSISGERSEDLCFPLGLVYEFMYLNRKAERGFSVIIDTKRLLHFHGNIESFYIAFSDGMIIHGSHGVLCTYCA